MEFDFITNAEADSVDNFPDDVKPLYQKNSAGKFTIPDTLKPLTNAFMANGAKLKKALTDKTNANSESAQRRLLNSAIMSILPDLGIETTDDYNDLNKAAELLPKALKEKFGALTAGIKGANELNINVENVRKDATAKIAAKDAEAKAAIEAANAKLHGYVIKAEVTSALNKAKTVDGGADLLLPLIQRSVKVIDEEGALNVRVIGEDGTPRMSATGGWLGVDGLIGELKAKFPMAFVSETKGGSGTKPGAAAAKTNVQTPGEMSSADKIKAGLIERGILK